MKFECRNVTKAYGSVIALRDANLSVEKGEIRAILGGNGSGKSTLAKIIGGIIAKDSGELFKDGSLFKPDSPSQAKKQRVIVTSQELSLLTNLTVGENLTLPNLPKKFGVLLDKKEINRKSLEVLERLGLSGLVNEPIFKLFPNKQYLVEFAKALLQNPEILVIDEITSALYREDVDLVSTFINELSSNGCSILFISHRMHEIFSICQTVSVMRNGHVVNTHDVKDVDENTLLALLTGYEQDYSTEESSDALQEVKANAKVLLNVRNLKMHSFNTTIDLEVNSGEVVGIAGLQGQGQSELVRSLYGLNGPIKIILDNEEKLIRSPAEAVKSGMAFISGDRIEEGTFCGRSVKENLSVVNDGVLKRKKLKHKDILSQVTVKYDTLLQSVESLSGGNQQKVIIGRWTAVEPKILLADDPTKGVDLQARRDVHKIFNKLAQSGSVIIYVSSDEEELVELVSIAKSSRVLVIYKGKIVKTLKGQQVTLHNLISASLPVSEVGRNEHSN